MSSRVLISSSLIKTIQKNNRNLGLHYAVRTTKWIRASGQLADSVKKGFAEAMSKFSDAKVPSNAVSAIMTETEHPSQMDSYLHYTFVFHDSNGNEIGVGHAYP